MRRSSDKDTVPYSDVSEGMRLMIHWSSMSGKGGDATGKVIDVHRGGVADPNGLQQFKIRADDGDRYRVYVDAGSFEGGRTNPQVERLRDGAIDSVGSLTMIYDHG